MVTSSLRIAALRHGIGACGNRCSQGFQHSGRVFDNPQEGGYAMLPRLVNSMTREEIEREGYEVPSGGGTCGRPGWRVTVEGMDDAQMDAMTEFLRAHGLRARRRMVPRGGR